MKLLSLFAGIGGFDLAAKRCGIATAYAAEIDRAARRVFARHFPETTLIEDVRNVTEEHQTEIITAGWPCQGNSVAGRRAGLSDPRSGLWGEVRRILEACRPRWFFGENVPGLLSVNRGRDFGLILRDLAELGYGTAYRILDAQYFRVPQRRRRVFIVGCLGSWRRSTAVLFEREVVCGNSKTVRKKEHTVTNTLRARSNASHRADSDNYVPAMTVGTIPASDGGASSGMHPVIAHTLNAKGGSGRSDAETETETFLPSVVGFSGRMRGDDGRGYDRPPNVTGDLAGTVDTVKPGNVAGPSIGVRRLTPRECERLQGFPDDWTAIAADGKSLSDSARYRLIGNSVAVPCVEWIMRRIVEVSA
jgi:DNA (cytosine-5)-methyltransferase 1